MSYSDNDIRDLIDELSTIGAAEGLAEKANKIINRIPFYRIKSTPEISEILTSEGIPHNFCSITYLYQDEPPIHWRKDFIVVRGKTVFYQNKFSTGALLEDLEETIKNMKVTILSQTQHTDLNQLLCNKISILPHELLR